jgi:hypothetical protein
MGPDAGADIREMMRAVTPTATPRAWRADPRVLAFVERVGWTLNSEPILLSLRCNHASPPRTVAELCAALADGVTCGELSLELLRCEAVREACDRPQPPTVEEVVAVPCEAARLMAIAVPCSDLGELLAAMVAGKNPFTDVARHILHDHARPWLPVYCSYYDHGVPLPTARALAGGLLDALGVSTTSDFALLEPRAFAREVLAPTLAGIGDPAGFYFYDLGNDSILVFGGEGQLFVLLTTGTD